MDDYNRWADVTGDPGWSWKNLLPYFFKVGFPPNSKWSLIQDDGLTFVECGRTRDGLLQLTGTTLMGNLTLRLMDTTE